MKHLTILYFCLLVYSCKDKQANFQNVGSYSQPDSIGKTKAGILEIDQDTLSTLTIKDKSKYSQTFLENLKRFTYSKHYQLIDSILIVGNLDTAYFPTDIPLNKNVTLIGCKNNACYTLTVNRKNYTSVAYQLETNGQPSTLEKGNVELGAGFILASEIDEDERTGVAYSATEYFNETEECYFAIRIGRNDNEILSAKLVKSCKDTTKNIDLYDYPTLYEK